MPFEVRLAVRQQPRHVLHSFCDLEAASAGEGWRLEQPVVDGPQALVNVEERVALPASLDVELPAHARQRRGHEAPVHLPCDRHSGRIDPIPALLESRELLPSLRHGRARPVGNPPVGLLQALDVVARDRLMEGAPLPEILAELLQLVGASRVSQSRNDEQVHRHGQPHTPRIMPRGVFFGPTA